MTDDQVRSRWTEAELTVRKLAYYQPINLLGLDEQGRQLYICPTAGCGETAYFDEDGKGHCPTGDAIQDYLAKAYEDMRRLLPEALGLAVDPEFIPVHLEEVRRAE